VVERDFAGVARNRAPSGENARLSQTLASFHYFAVARLTLAQLVVVVRLS